MTGCIAESPDSDTEETASSEQALGGLLRDGGFEAQRYATDSGHNGWFIPLRGAGRAERVSPGYKSDHALRVWDPDPGTVRVFQVVDGIEPGAVYEVSTMTRHVAGGQTQTLRMRFLDAKGKQIGDTHKALPEAGARWNLMTLAAEAPADAFSVEVAIVGNLVDLAKETRDWDNLALKQVFGG
jgi:hypothetical protein